MIGSQHATASPGQAQLRLYIAGSTPNSVRAEQNLRLVLDACAANGQTLGLDVIDVFTNGRRAVNDGVIVTPTLVVVHDSQRYTIVGDLSDGSQVRSLLESLALKSHSEQDQRVGGTAE